MLRYGNKIKALQQSQKGRKHVQSGCQTVCKHASCLSKYLLYREVKVTTSFRKMSHLNLWQQQHDIFFMSAYCGWLRYIYIFITRCTWLTLFQMFAGIQGHLIFFKKSAVWQDEHLDLPQQLAPLSPALPRRPPPQSRTHTNINTHIQPLNVLRITTHMWILEVKTWVEEADNHYTHTCTHTHTHTLSRYAREHKTYTQGSKWIKHLRKKKTHTHK